MEQITGRERIGWRQDAASVAHAQAHDYLIYVDGVRTPLATVTCQPGSASPAECSSALPTLSPGRHVLELTASSGSLESPRSPALVVFVSPVASSASLSSSQTERRDPGDVERSVVCTTGEQVCADVETVVPSLAGARAVTALPDGRVLVVQGDGGILAVEPHGGVVSISVDAPCRLPLASRLSAIAVSADFLTDRRVYAAWTCEDHSATHLLLMVSYREVGGSLGEAQVAEVMRTDNALVTLAAGSRQRLYFVARQQSRWALYRTVLPEDGAHGAAEAVMALSSNAAITSSRDRLFVSTHDRLLTWSPDSDTRMTLSPKGWPQPARDSAPIFATSATDELQEGVNGRLLWIANGMEICRLDLSTATLSQPLRLPGRVLAMDATTAGQVYALVTSASSLDPGTPRLIRFTVR